MLRGSHGMEINIARLPPRWKKCTGFLRECIAVYDFFGRHAPTTSTSESTIQFFQMQKRGYVLKLP